MRAEAVEAARDRLRYDTPFWSRHCATILNPQRQPVRLEPRPWQARTPDTPEGVVPLDEALETQRAAGRPMRVIILKSRKLGMCLDPATRVLTADLRWVRIDDVEPGQELVATDEEVPGGRGRARKMRRAVVEGVRFVRKDAFLLKMDNGERLVATAEHRFLQRRRSGTEAIWRAVGDTRPGDYIRHITKPWERGGYEDGWFGGMIDGEGSYNGVADLSVSQRPGSVYDRARDYLTARGYNFREEYADRSASGYQPCLKVCVGRMNELFRLIGQTRPTRFIGSGWWEGRDLPGKRTGVAWSKVESITPLGPRTMVDLQTSTKTFIAEGFVSHNSTWMQAKLLQRVTQLPFRYALTICHRDDAAAVMWRMAALMYRRLPSEEELGLGFSIKPRLLSQGGGNKQGGHLTFGDPMRPEEASLYETQTAGSEGGGRSATPDAIHASEVAFWRSADYLTGLMNALPLEPETMAVLESTANGFNFFHDLWQRAVTGAEDPDTGVLWQPIFYGWTMNPFNALPFHTDAARDRFEKTLGDETGGGDPEELELVEQFGVTLEQLNWRRSIISGPEAQGNIDFFRQEHPATPNQAFIGSGQPVFPGLLVSRMIREAQEAAEPVQGVLRAEDPKTRNTRSGTIEVPQRALWVPEGSLQAVDEETWSTRDRLLVWQHPVNAASEALLPELERKPPGQYIVFADIAQGTGTASEESDYSAVQVLDHVNRVQVARYRARIAVHELPLLLVLIATYYNEALLAVEANNMGIGVVDSLAKDYHYRYLYKRRRAGDDARVDAHGSGLIIGWLTTLKTKPLMEQTFGQALKEGEHGLRDVVTGREFTTYVKDPKNAAKHGAQRGAFDDLAVSFMGAHRVAAEHRPRDPNARRGGRMRGWRVGDDVTGA